MYSLRRLRAIVMNGTRELEPHVIHDRLQASSVPVTLADCRTCLDPCEEGRASRQRLSDNV
jgi:hypothetical protein